MTHRNVILDRTVVTTILLLGAFAAHARGADSRPDLDSRFNETVRPFLQSYCVGCHAGGTSAAQFDLSVYTSTAAVVQDYPRWILVLDKLTAKQMPPEPVKQPPDDARQQVTEWIDAVLMDEAQ